MRFIEEFRDPVLAGRILDRLKGLARRPVTLMEVCGSHTVAIHRSGLRKLLPETIRLVSGPGCPVCVTSQADVDRAIDLSRRPEVIFTTFGDMIRVPGTEGNLMQSKAAGADVRVVYSPADALEIAAANPDRTVIFFAAGFETTAPTVAATVKRAAAANLGNFRIFPVHKLIPPAMRALLSMPDVAIDGFLAPGHVSVIIGEEAYRFIAEEFGKPIVVTGFEPVDILQGILMTVTMLEEGRAAVGSEYGRVVPHVGNPRAREIMDEVFRPVDAWWRGIGLIPGSGLGLTDGYAAFDARPLIPDDRREDATDLPGCSCGEVLKGRMEPEACPLFGGACTPENPVGPCMVSSEGSCAAHYRYGGEEGR